LISLGTLKLVFDKADSLWVRHSHLHSHITTIDSCNWRVQLNLYISHKYSECRERLSHGNHQAPSHRAAAVTHIDTSDMSYTDVAPQPSTLSPVEIETLIHQVLSKSNLNTAMSTALGNSS
jgi:hypothetical protein